MPELFYQNYLFNFRISQIEYKNGYDYENFGSDGQKTHPSRRSIEKTRIWLNEMKFLVNKN